MTAQGVDVGQGKLVSGKVNLDVSASGTGKQWDRLQTSVNGTGLAQLFDGALLDFNVFRQVLDSYNFV